jgi:hypothetical protein
LIASGRGRAYPASGRRALGGGRRAAGGGRRPAAGGRRPVIMRLGALKRHDHDVKFMIAEKGAGVGWGA